MASSTRARSATPPSAQTEHTVKRMRTDQTNLQADSLVGLQGAQPNTFEELPLALRIAAAIKHAQEWLPPIGYCPTKLNRMSALMIGDGPDGLTRKDVEIPHERTLQGREKAKANRNAKIIGEIAKIYKDGARESATGLLETSFALRITRKDCTYSDRIPPKSSQSDEGKVEVQNRLKEWFSKADVSGYGDMREHTTKFDEEVRSAREIPASEFSVDAELLTRIADLWNKHFLWNNNVRVEPYKIHLYGPKGHFKSHRDTPEKGLVGTFLLGLGDTSYRGALQVNNLVIRADEGRWCAFYPDVPHEVTELSSDAYRAVIAFKIFHGTGTKPKTEAATQQISELMREMRAPFGILLERKYCLGTIEFSGFDSLLIASAEEQYGERTKHLPVVVKASSSWGSTSERNCYEDYEMYGRADVYPFTRGHVDALSRFNPDHWYNVRRINEAAGCPWLVDVKNIPFFSLDLERSLHVYETEQQETCNYYGNEAQQWREDSVYLSYALLVLPSNEPTSGSDCSSDST